MFWFYAVCWISVAIIVLVAILNYEDIYKWWNNVPDESVCQHKWEWVDGYGTVCNKCGSCLGKHYK